MRKTRITRDDFVRIVVAVDPAVTSDEDADDTGIVVVARGPHQPETCQFDKCPGHGYVLDDRTCHLPPHGWAKIAVQAYDDWEADRIVAEVNNGGDMVGETIHAVRVGIPYTKVTATRGKRLRAEPISALYEQGRMHHVGVFAELEAEMNTWTPDAEWSPNRLDALVWGATHLGLIGAQGAAFMAAWSDVAPRQATPVELAALPVHEPFEVTPARDGCAHRWFDGVCVFCGGSRA